MVAAKADKLIKDLSESFIVPFIQAFEFIVALLLSKSLRRIQRFLKTEKTFFE